MQKLYVGLVALAMLAVATPVNAATETTTDKNVAYILEMLGDHDLTQPVTFADGSVMSLADAIELTAARAGNVDLAALASASVGNPMGSAAGDIWILEIGNGGCTNTVLAPQPFFLAPHGQLWIYNGGVGTQTTSHGYITLVIAWTTKVTGGFFTNTAGYSLAGATDFFCFGFAGLHIAFPFADGVSRLN